MAGSKKWKWFTSHLVSGKTFRAISSREGITYYTLRRRVRARISDFISNFTPSPNDFRPLNDIHKSWGRKGRDEVEHFFLELLPSGEMVLPSVVVGWYPLATSMMARRAKRALECSRTFLMVDRLELLIIYHFLNRFSHVSFRFRFRTDTQDQSANIRSYDSKASH